MKKWQKAEKQVDKFIEKTMEEEEEIEEKEKKIVVNTISNEIK